MADDMEKIGREENEDSRAYPVACPVTGEVIPLSQIPDSTFASGIMGSLILPRYVRIRN